MSNKEINAKIVRSESYDPWINLALEEHLFNSILDGEIILYLWQNDNTVVIGHNQNAWKECDYEKLEKDGGKLARRLSGGGAVYHDLGNFNFTFIIDRKIYDLTRQHKVIVNALKKFGVIAEFSGRNDMLIDGKKFSGHAYYFNGNKAYHHGTIMVSSNLDKLGVYLKPSKKKITSKGVDSVRSRVINVCDANSSVTIPIVQKSMEESFLECYGQPACECRIYSGNEDSILELSKKYASWDWRFGQSPKFDISYTERFNWGEVEIGFTLKSGEIVSCKVYTDAMDTELFIGIPEKIVGLKLMNDVVSNFFERTLNNNVSEEIRTDIVNWSKTF